MDRSRFISVTLPKGFWNDAFERVRKDAMMYEIMLRGELDASWSKWFGRVDIGTRNLANGSIVTVLTFRDADQPALFGVLERIRDLNLSLVSVNCFDDRQ